MFILCLHQCCYIKQVPDNLELVTSSWDFSSPLSSDILGGLLERFLPENCRIFAGFAHISAREL